MIWKPYDKLRCLTLSYIVLRRIYKMDHTSSIVKTKWSLTSVITTLSSNSQYVWKTHESNLV